MSSQSISFAPENSIVFVADPSNDYDVPEDTGAALVTATPTCMAIGTLAQMDGKTTITLGGPGTRVSGELIFQGLLKTPGRKVAILQVPGTVVLEMKVPKDGTGIKVWANDLREPNQILVIAD